MRPNRRKSDKVNVGLAAVAALALGLAAFSLRSAPGPSAAEVVAGQRLTDRSAAQADLLARQRPARIVFFGDSYTGGSAEGGNGAAGWPALVSNKLRWTYTLNAVGGSGFINAGTGQPFGARIAAVLAGKPDVIVVEGGHNDVQMPPAVVLAASTKVLSALRAGDSHAKLLVIGPIWPNASAPAAARAIDDGLRRQAAATGAVFLDPIQAGWFTGRYAALIGGDKTHPTDQGHQYIADLVYPALLGLHQPDVVTDPRP